MRPSQTEILKTHTFGEATEKVGQFTEDEFISIREGIIEMNKELIAIDSRKTSKDFVLDIPYL